MTWEENYLAHYGIKGQSWGIRRFQNEDGTLTEEGKQRYGVDGDEKYDSKDLEPGKHYKDASDKALALRRKQIEGIQNTLRKQSLIQSALGVSMIAVGAYNKSHGNRSFGTLLQNFGKGYLIGTGVGHVVGTGASHVAKKILKNEEDARKKKNT